MLSFFNKIGVTEMELDFFKYKGIFFYDCRIDVIDFCKSKGKVIKKMIEGSRSMLIDLEFSDDVINILPNNINNPKLLFHIVNLKSEINFPSDWIIGALKFHNSSTLPTFPMCYHFKYIEYCYSQLHNYFNINE
jgi:hypothetical protein